MAAVESRKRRTERLTPRGHRREEREADGERGRREMDRVLAGQQPGCQVSCYNCLKKHIV